MYTQTESIVERTVTPEPSFLDVIIHLYFYRLDDTSRKSCTPALGTATIHPRCTQVLLCSRALVTLSAGWSRVTSGTCVFGVPQRKYCLRGKRRCVRAFAARQYTSTLRRDRDVWSILTIENERVAWHRASGVTLRPTDEPPDINATVEPPCSGCLIGKLATIVRRSD